MCSASVKNQKHDKKSGIPDHESIAVTPPPALTSGLVLQSSFERKKTLLSHKLGILGLHRPLEPCSRSFPFFYYSLTFLGSKPFFNFNVRLFHQAGERPKNFCRLENCRVSPLSRDEKNGEDKRELLFIPKNIPITNLKSIPKIPKIPKIGSILTQDSIDNVFQIFVLDFSATLVFIIYLMIRTMIVSPYRWGQRSVQTRCSELMRQRKYKHYDSFCQGLGPLGYW